MDTSPPLPRLAFDRCVLLPGTRQLLVDGQPARLGSRAFDLLLTLVQHRHRVMGKNELIALVWPGLVVEENNLRVHVAALRKLLGPAALATIPGRGYRFTLAQDGDETEPPTARPASTGAATASATVADRIPGDPPSPPAVFGRATELASLRQTLQDHALVTLVGPGGIGKTTVARAVVRSLQADREQECSVVELAPVTDDAQVSGAVAEALGLPATAGEHADALAAELASRRFLLVLDNCEQVAGGVARLATALHAAAPGVRLLATSQLPLNLSFERRVRLEPLSLPATASLADARSAGAVALFEARAAAADSRFSLGEHNVAAVTAICRQLDGVPLAIELAAARVALLGVEGLRTRLNERFRVLTSGSRLAQPRHQTLQATLDWSHGLLSSDEQTVFRRLGVFVGGFALTAVQQLASDDQIDEWTVLDLLGSLIDKSMVGADTSGAEALAAGASAEEATAEPRYRLLETLREYGVAQLQARGELDAMRRRHAAFYADLAQTHGTLTAVLRSGGERWRLVVDHDDLRAALDWAAVHDAPLALRTAAALVGFWRERGHHAESERRCTSLLAHPDNRAASPARVRVLMGLCTVTNERGDIASLRPLAQAVLEGGQALGDLNFQGLGHVWMAHAVGHDMAASEQEYRLALPFFRATGEPARVAETLTNIACTLIEQRRAAEAQPLLEEAHALYASVDNAWGLGFANATLGEAAYALGDFDTARQRAEQSLVYHRRLQHQHRITASLLLLAAAACRLGRQGEVRQALGECLAITVAHGFSGHSLRALVLAAMSAEVGPDAERAASLLGAAQGLRDACEPYATPLERAEHEAVIERVQAHLGGPAWQSAWQCGRGLAMDEVVALALHAP